MACADCKHYGKGWRDDIGRCRWDPAEGWPLVYASEDYPVVNEWDGEGCPQFKAARSSRSAPMASEDVLKRAGKFLIDRTDDMDAWYMVGDLAAEVRELRKDKARLDWLIDNCFSYKSTGTDRLGDLVEDREDIDAAMGGES